MKKNPRTAATEVVTELSPKTLKELYTTMLRIRKFEEKAAELILQKKIKCPVHLYIGQEAVATGVCANLRREDCVFSNHRNHGHYIAKGGSLKKLMAEMHGRVTGCSRGRGGSMHLSSPDVGFPGSSAIVAGSIPAAVGVALSFFLQESDNVSVTFFGDGAMNEGAWYESLNFASLRKLPVIFVCENNLYATHMPISACHADTRLYKKAEAFGVPGIRIDGNDVMAVYETAKKAVGNARRGRGPTLIECMTYRWRGHVGPNYDLDKGLRSKEELDSWMERCPIKALRGTLLESGIVSESGEKDIRQSVDAEVEEALVFARESPYPASSESNRYVFSK